jgi:hypothetical protein
MMVIVRNSVFVLVILPNYIKHRSLDTIQSQVRVIMTSIGNMDQTSKNLFAKQLFANGIYSKG